MKKITSILLALGIIVECLGVIKTQAAEGDISLFAGGGARDGSAATSALLNYPHTLVFDAAGNKYFTEFYNHRVRRVDAITGIISTVAGIGRAGFSGDGALATLARINGPTGIDIDSSGNIYFADTFNRRVRRIDNATGVITTVAGTGNLFPSSSCAGGTATSENLFNPVGVTIDSSDDILVAIQNGNRVCKIDDSTLAITLVAGTGGFSSGGDGGAATAASFRGTNFMVFDSLNNLYISELNGHRIRKVDAITGNISTYAGTGTQGFSGDTGLATAAQLSTPGGMVVDSSDHLFVVDGGNNRIRRIDAGTGIITTVAGTGSTGFSGDSGLATGANLTAVGLGIDSSDHLYIGDFGNDRIRKVDAGTNIITTVAGSGNGDGSLPLDMTLDAQGTGLDIDLNGNIYIADGSLIRRINASNQTLTTIAGTGGAGYSGDGGPALSAQVNAADIAVDTQGHVYFSDVTAHVIRKVDMQTGIITTVAGTGSACPGASTDPCGDAGLATAAQLDFPNGVEVDTAGNIYIADGSNNRIRKVDAVTGIITTVAGTGTSGFLGDGGSALAARLAFPFAVRVDSSNNIFIADFSNQRIRKVDAATGNIETIAGNGTAAFAGDGGLATSASLSSPVYVHIDALGDVFISDRGNQRIRKVDTTTGLISTFAGIGAPAGSPFSGGSSGDGGSATLAEINFPRGLAFDLTNQFYVLENNLIRKIEHVFVSASGGGRRFREQETNLEEAPAEDSEPDASVQSEDQQDSREGEQGSKDQGLHGVAPEIVSYKLIPLITALNQAFAWTSPSDYQLRSSYRQLLDSADRTFKTRKIIRIIGQEYQQRELGSSSDFSFREIETDPVLHIADLMKAMVLSFGEKCFSSQEMAKAKKFDRPTNRAQWWRGYWSLTFPLFAEFLEKKNFVAWDFIEKIRTLDLLEQFLTKTCKTND